MPARRFDAPSGIVGWRFLYALVVEITGFRQRCWNAEGFIFFQMVILQCARHVTRYSMLRWRIYFCLDDWEAREFGMLAEDTARTCVWYLSTSRGGGHS